MSKPDIKNDVLLREKVSSQSLEKLNVYNEKKIDSLSELKGADHVVIVVDQKKYCHAIIENINLEKSIIDIIYYGDSETQHIIDQFLLNSTSAKIYPNLDAGKYFFLIFFYSF